MNLLFFNRSFYPSVEATGQFLTELCEDLSAFGHNVTVIAGRHEKHFLIKRDKYKSIELIRAGGTNLPKEILLFRLINLGTYFLSAFVAGFLVRKKPDIVIAQTDPPVLGLLGIFFSRWYRAKFIYSCQDIYPEIGIITGKLTNPILTFLLKAINLFSFKKADKVICLGEDMKKIIVNKGISKDKVEIVHNWADTNVLKSVNLNENPFRLKHNLQNGFTLMYSGNIGLTQNLEKILEVAKYFKSKNNVKFLLVGDGANKNNLQKLALKAELLNVYFLSYQPKEELKYSLNAPDIHLITFQKGLAGIIVPSKIYGILACGKPFIAWIDEESEISIIARKFKCGIVVPPGDIKKMISTIEWSINNSNELVKMGENGRKASEKFFDRKISTRKFNNIVESLVY